MISILMRSRFYEKARSKKTPLLHASRAYLPQIAVPQGQSKQNIPRDLVSVHFQSKTLHNSLSKWVYARPRPRKRMVAFQVSDSDGKHMDHWRSQGYKWLITPTLLDPKPFSGEELNEGVYATHGFRNQAGTPGCSCEIIALHPGVGKQSMIGP